MELSIENALNIGSDEFYRASRYNLPLVVMLVNSEDKKAFNILEESIRQTDVIQQLSPDSIIVFLSHTDSKDASLFIEKIKDKFDFTYTVEQFKAPKYKFLESLFVSNIYKSVAF